METKMRWVGLASYLLRDEHDRLERKIDKLSRKPYKKVAREIEVLRESQVKIMEAVSELYKIKEEKEQQISSTT